jgi:hypothetical protein
MISVVPVIVLLVIVLVVNVFIRVAEIFIVVVAFEVLFRRKLLLGRVIVVFLTEVSSFFVNPD